MTESNVNETPGTRSKATVELGVLRVCSDRLAALAGPLTPDELRRPAYPSQWTIAQVLSHLGSAAVIMKKNLETILAGDELDGSFAQSTWDEWNAKSPEDQAADFLRADRELMERLASVTPSEQAAFILPLGPMKFDYAAYLGTRVNEVALHTWDIAVVFDPAATVSPEAVELVVDRLAMIAGWTGKPTGSDRVINVLASAPTRRIEIALRPDAVSFEPSAEGAPDLELPAEAVVRLVYGRLDPDHTPPVGGLEPDLDELRRAFPGV
jgi:uncharacterized protein (TIGR03083 family)